MKKSFDVIWQLSTVLFYLYFWAILSELVAENNTSSVERNTSSWKKTLLLDFGVWKDYIWELPSEVGAEWLIYLMVAPSSVRLGWWHPHLLIWWWHPHPRAIRFQRDYLWESASTTCTVSECPLSPLHAIISYGHHNHPVRNSFKAVTCEPPSTRVHEVGPWTKTSLHENNLKGQLATVNMRQDAFSQYAWIYD